MLDGYISMATFHLWLDGLFQFNNTNTTNTPLTRLEASLTAAQAFFMYDRCVSILSRFQDYYLIPEANRPAMAALVEAGIIRGHGSSSDTRLLDTDGNLTYGQAAALLALSAGPIFFEPGHYYGLNTPGNAIINTGGVHLYDAFVGGNLIITGQSSPIFINGNFSTIVVKTETPIHIDGYVEYLNIVVDNASITFATEEPYSSMYTPTPSKTTPSPTPQPPSTPAPSVTLPLTTPAPSVTLPPTTPELPSSSPIPTYPPTLISRPTPLPTLTPVLTPTPIPTPTPHQTPIPASSTPTPTPQPNHPLEPYPLGNPILINGNFAFVIDALNGQTITIDENNPLFGILYALHPLGQPIINYPLVTGAIANYDVNQPLIELCGQILDNLPSFELHLAPNVALKLDGLYGDLSDLVIVGIDNNEVTITPVLSDTTISVSGSLILDIVDAASALNFHHFTINLVGETNLYFYSFVTVPVRLELATKDAIHPSSIKFNNILVHISSCADIIIPMTSLTNGNLQIYLPNLTPPPPLQPLILPQDSESWVEQHRFIYYNNAGIRQYRYF